MILPRQRTTAPTLLPGPQQRSALPLPVVISHAATREPVDARAQHLFGSLPYACRLSMTSQRFPHVLNRIAAEWENPARLLRMFNELLIDDRGNREGFPFDTVLELTNLRDYYVHEVRPGLRLPGPQRTAQHNPQRAARRR